MYIWKRLKENVVTFIHVACETLFSQQWHLFGYDSLELDFHNSHSTAAKILDLLVVGDSSCVDCRAVAMDETAVFCESGKCVFVVY